MRNHNSKWYSVVLATGTIAILFIALTNKGDVSEYSEHNAISEQPTINDSLSVIDITRTPMETLNKKTKNEAKADIGYIDMSEFTFSDESFFSHINLLPSFGSSE